MKAVKELRKKAAARATKKAQVYSTSEARANFAEALETAQLQNTVIGFDRYGRPVAALVSLDAVKLLAGMGDKVEPAVREKIKRMATLFLHNIPAEEPLKAPMRAAKAKKPPAKTPAKKARAAKKKPGPAKKR
jgi:hypothetical protein